MGVELNPVTSGPVVNDSLETSISGVFACGNVLHVHDLVDYVSEEAGIAGANAAHYILSGNTADACNTSSQHSNAAVSECSQPSVEIIPTGGVRYTVPKTLHVANMDDELTGSVWDKFIKTAELLLTSAKNVSASGNVRLWLRAKWNPLSLPKNSLPTALI